MVITPRCRRCGYHLTQLAIRWSCDACLGKVPLPVPWKAQEQVPEKTYSPTGLSGDELLRWLMNHPRTHVTCWYRDQVWTLHYTPSRGLRADGPSILDLELWDCEGFTAV